MRALVGLSRLSNAFTADFAYLISIGTVPFLPWASGLGLFARQRAIGFGPLFWGAIS
jgi:hypothetical protein